MEFHLEGKNAVVTGGGRGLCKSIAQALHDAGAQVILVGSSKAAADTAREMGRDKAPVFAVRGDVSSAEGAKGIFEKCMKLCKDRIDILVNGAGIQYRENALDFPAEQWEKVLAVNLSGAFYLTQMVGNVMVKNGYGKILNIASMTSFVGGIRIPAYAASKGAVAQLTKALSNEWAPKGINVNAIAPGYMETELTRSIKEQDPDQYQEITRRIPMGRWGRGEDLKGIAVFLASDASAYITGAIIPVDGGYLGK